MNLPDTWVVPGRKFVEYRPVATGDNQADGAWKDVRKPKVNVGIRLRGGTYVRWSGKIKQQRVTGRLNGETV